MKGRDVNTQDVAAGLHAEANLTLDAGSTERDAGVRNSGEEASLWIRRC
jgi:hypothetical protein